MRTPILWIAIPAFVACASDPNKDLQTARDVRTTEYRANVHAQQNLSARQRAERAELANRQSAARANATKTTMTDLAADNAKVESATAEVVKDRQMFDAEMRDRLAKIDARAHELHVRTMMAPATVQNAVHAMWVSFSTDRPQAGARLGYLPANGEALTTAKADVRARVDALERTLDTLSSKLR